MKYLLLAIFNEAFETTATICGSGFTTQTYCNRGENGAFATAVMANNEVDERTQPDCEKVVTHEIGHGDGFDNAIIRGRIVGIGQCLLLGDILCSLFYKFFIVRDWLRNIAMVVSVKRYPLFFPLHTFSRTITPDREGLTDACCKVDEALSTSMISISPSSTLVRWRFMGAILGKECWKLMSAMLL